MTLPWKLAGDIVLSCNCEVFCPCVVSLGKSAPSHGICHTWWALKIDEGHAGDEPLNGLNVAVLMDIPGPLAEGKWSVGLYIDERASEPARAALLEILSGSAGGTTAWFSIMIAENLGTRYVPIQIGRHRSEFRSLQRFRSRHSGPLYVLSARGHCGFRRHWS